MMATTPKCDYRDRSADENRAPDAARRVEWLSY
jgi:hypothetical protein